MRCWPRTSRPSRCAAAASRACGWPSRRRRRAAPTRSCRPAIPARCSPSRCLPCACWTARTGRRLASFLPTARGETVMLDLGANLECDADNLAEFAVMGSVFAQVLLGLDRPKVGLLNVGSEELKGHEELRQAAGVAAPRGRARRLPRLRRGQRHRCGRDRRRGDRRLHRQRRAEVDRRHGQALYPVRARGLPDIDLRQDRLSVRRGRLDQAAQAGRPAPLQRRRVPGPRRRLREKPRRHGCAGLRLRHRRGGRPGPLRIQEQACRGPGQAAPGDLDRRGASTPALQASGGAE